MPSKKQTESTRLGYFDSLIEVLANTEATEANGTPVAVAAAVDRAIDLILAQASQGYKVIFIGNGGSAAIASHLATDFWRNGGVKAVSFNDACSLTCISNDFGYEQVFEKPIQMFAEAGDILIAISSSGRSANIVKAVEQAKKAGCHVITLSGFDRGNRLRSLGELNFYSPSHAYGFVELSHTAICHCIADSIVGRKVR